MKILVTGGAGFIGSHVVDTYISLGHSVVVIDNLSTGKKQNVNPKATFYQADIRDQSIGGIFAKEKIEIVNHHAAQISVRDSVKNPSMDADINIIGLLNIVNTALITGVKKIIFASSGGAIYGEAITVPTPEDYQPLHPLSPYGISKMAGEHYLLFYQKAKAIPCVLLRYANVYGPRQDPHGEAGVVAIFTQKMLSGDSTIINGDGEQVRDFVYVKDIARANTVVLKDMIQGIFNIGTGKGTSVNTLHTTIKKITQSKNQAHRGPPKPGEQKTSIVAIQRARQVLSWTPQISLDKGLEQTVEYFRGA